MHGNKSKLYYSDLLVETHKEFIILKQNTEKHDHTHLWGQKAYTDYGIIIQRLIIYLF